MSGRDCDVAVVGAGIHGCGVALAAAAAGYAVTVIERTAPAAGTSGRSSKLIHGGLRYLETAQLRLVRESLVEKRWLLAQARELVQPVPMHVPVYAQGSRSPWTIRAGLSAYMLLAGLRRDARFVQVPRGEWDALDGLTTHGLRAVFRYMEARTDDAALTRAVLAAAVALGTEVMMPASLVAGEIDEAGVTLVTGTGEDRNVLRAATVVNAAGPWAGEVAGMIRPAPSPPAFELVQGSHLEFEGGLAHGGYYVEAPDGRGVFALPRDGRTMVGTTEHPYDGDPASSMPTGAERAYLQRMFDACFPGRAGARPVAEWSGLRVLPAGRGSAFRRSRETRFHVDDASRPRMVGIFGGKLTTWRATARKALAKLGPALPEVRPRQDLEKVVLRAP